MGRLQDSLEQNTEQQKQLYREQYYANHGEYPPEPEGCLSCLFRLLLIPFVWMFKGIYFLFKWMFKGIFLMFKGIFYTFPKFLWKKGKIGKILFAVYIAAWIFAIGVSYVQQQIAERKEAVKKELEEKNAITAFTRDTELNLRSGPSSNEKIIQIIPKNTMIKVIEVKEGEQWVKILYNNSRGYVNRNYILFEESPE